MVQNLRHAGFAIAVVAALAAAGCRGEDASAGGGDAKAAEDVIPKGDAGRRLYFEKRCNEGHYGMCGELGLMWEKGWGGAKDKAKADVYHRKACDHAVADSCTAIGVELQPGKELEILEKNCKAGSAFDCNNQGQLLLTGTDAAADPARARPLLEKGCAAGYASSCRALGHIFGQGLGVNKDEAKAKEYIAKADAADAAVRELEVKYFHIPPRDQLPVGHAAKGLVDEIKGGASEQDEENRKIIEDALKKVEDAAKGVAPEPKK